MTEIVVPVKNLAYAKQRLAGVLSPDQRAGLVLAMLEDLLANVAEIDSGHIWVVSNDDDVFEIARKYGARQVREMQPEGYNPAVSLGLAAVSPACSVAVLPGDVPLAIRSELTALTAPVKSASRTVRLAAARDRRGTNGLFLSSRDLLDPGFGPNSFVGYQRTARRAGLKMEIVDAPGLAHDIDLPADLDDLMIVAKQSATGEFLNSVHYSDREYVLERGAA